MTMHASGHEFSYDNYINFGFTEYPELAEILRLRADTWYYAEGDELGTMSLGIAPRTPVHEAAAFVSQQLHVFGDAFKEIFHLDAPVEVSYYYGDKPNADGLLSGATVSVPVDASPRQLSEALPHAVIVGGARARFAVRAAMRDMHGAVDWRWISDAGRVWFTVTRSDQASRYDLEQGVPWHARVFVDILSLFRVNNQEVLDNARRLWSQLREEHPGMTTFFDALPEGNEVPHAGIITLAAPPAGTPSDNRDLYEWNEPGLRKAVARWEQAAGRPFQWTGLLEG